MLLFLVCLALSTVVATELGDPSILYQNYHGEYAQSYNDYKPHDYEYGYGVSDPLTGDHKSQWEVKEQGIVRGGYSLLEADGTTRVVEYVADDHGFRAIVKKIDQHGNTKVESHGHPEAHHEVAAAIPVAPTYAAQSPYQTYDGHVHNYIQNVEPVLVQKVAPPPIQIVQKAVAYAPEPLPAPLPVQPIQQEYYQEPYLQKEIAYAPVQQQIVQKSIQYAPVVSKQVIAQPPVHYAPAPLIQNEYISAPAPVVHKQIIPQVQQPIYQNYVAKSPYVVDLNSYGPKSEAVFVQPRAPVYHQPQYQPQYQPQQYQPQYQPEQYQQQQYQQQYEIPQPVLTQNVLTPVAKGISQYQLSPSPITIHPHGESSQSYYGTTGNIGESVPVGYNQQLAYSSPVGQQYYH
ncbi:unnamed protein product [Brassicogethes aeneus]|uniref:Uncharacterized protein n=1 Tax=Brassicogethes aeneus TaxID=1431903 RepID=A0A9P0BCK3_BRAAE|nr:unnamed protein product [Brassicogethes aeneus]